MSSPSPAPSTTPVKPPPVPDAWTEGFWQAAADGILALQRCSHCGRFAHPPVFVCPGCWNPDASFSYQPVSGRGVVRTWTVVHTPFLPAFAADVPFVIVQAELVEQPRLRLLANLLDGPDAPLRIGAPVEVVFESRADGTVLPQFRLAEAAS